MFGNIKYNNNFSLLILLEFKIKLISLEILLQINSTQFYIYKKNRIQTVLIKFVRLRHEFKQKQKKIDYKRFL